MQTEIKMKPKVSDVVIKQESSKKARIEALNYLVLYARYSTKLKENVNTNCWKFNNFPFVNTFFFDHSESDSFEY